MLIDEPLQFVKDFIKAIDESIQICHPEKHLSRIQKAKLAFMITAILITNSICWAKFQRCSLGKHSIATLSWILRKSGIEWNILLPMSVIALLRKFQITEGSLAIDDSDKERSKKTTQIHHVHKIKDKPSGGYIMGQCVVFLVLVTPKITIPVGFAFHMPDPKLKAWTDEIKRLKKQGVPKESRPAKPDRDENFPTIPQIAVKLLAQFKRDHASIRIRCIFADALYGSKEFFDAVEELFPSVQIISQIRSNQNVKSRNKILPVEKFFQRLGVIEQQLRIRGEKEVKVLIGSARLFLNAHGKKRFVIALQYEGEKEFRYLVASDLSWRTLDIAQAYTLRWLIEVFFEDWKGHEGWGQLTKQTGEEGSSRSLILSLLVDHCLFFHPDQQAQIENNLPAFTVGSLIDKIRVESLLAFIEGIISAEDSVDKFKQVSDLLKKEVMKPTPSKKHMIQRNLGWLEPSPSLRYRNAA